MFVVDAVGVELLVPALASDPPTPTPIPTSAPIPCECGCTPAGAGAGGAPLTLASGGTLSPASGRDLTSFPFSFPFPVKPSFPFSFAVAEPTAGTTGVAAADPEATTGIGPIAFSKLASNVGGGTGAGGGAGAVQAGAVPEIPGRTGPEYFGGSCMKGFEERGGGGGVFDSIAVFFARVVP